MRNGILAVVFFILLSVGVFGGRGMGQPNDDSLMLDDVRLTLGMSEAAARRLLNVHHNITEGGIVVSKGHIIRVRGIRYVQRRQAPVGQ